MSDFIPKIRFIVTSDVHVKEDKGCPELARFRRGMEYAHSYAKSCAYSKIDVLFVVGDFADRGKEAEMINFREALDECIDRTETDVIISISSHEYNAGEEVAKERLKRLLGMDYDVHKVIKGFHFISLSTTRGCNFDAPQKEFAAESLRIAAEDNPRAPIFFFQHPHVSGTVYGSINWGEHSLNAILMNYPQIIDFSGHSHAPINDPRNIHQQHFTSVGTGSFSYFELDEFDKMYGTIPPDANECAQFLIVEADENNRVRIMPFDVLSGKFFHEPWRIDSPGEPSSFSYTDRRYKTAVKPHFHESTHVETAQVPGGILLTFGQADISQDRVNDYKITVRRKSDGIIVKQLCIWSGYYLYRMPSSLTLTVDGLAQGEYEAEITARGFWNNHSDNSLRVGFTVAG